MQVLLFLSAKYLGYFLVMIIFLIISIVKAKKKTAWVYYIIGAGLQVFPLLGNQKQANYYGQDMSMDWLVYFGLLIICAMLISIRKAVAYHNETERTSAEITEECAASDSGIEHETPANKEHGAPTNNSLPTENCVAEEPTPEAHRAMTRAVASATAGWTVTASQESTLQEPSSYDAKAAKQNTTKEKEKTKKRFCSRCGNPVDSVTKKCTGCGKQYFKGIPWKNVSSVIVILLLVASCTLNLWQHAELSAANDLLDKERLASSALKGNIATLNKRIDALESEQSTNDTETMIVSNIRVIIGNQSHKCNCPKVNPEKAYPIMGRAKAMYSGYEICSLCA